MCRDSDTARTMREGVSHARLADIVLAHLSVTLAAINVVIDTIPP